MTRFCPRCKGVLIRDKKYSKYRKCKKCGYKETLSGAPIEEQNLDFKLIQEPEDIKVRREDKERTLPIEFLEDKPTIHGKMTEEEKEKIRQRAEAIRNYRKQQSVQKILKKLRKSKYSGLRGEKINIGGELYEV